MTPEELSPFPFFRDLTHEQMEKLAPIFWRKTFAAGETVFSQNSDARCVYVIESGEVILRFFPEDGGSVDIETITAEGIFGWSAALGRPRYTSSAICLTPVKVIATRGVDLRRIMRGDKDLGLILIERMAQIVSHRFDGFRSQLKALLAVEE